MSNRNDRKVNFKNESAQPKYRANVYTTTSIGWFFEIQNSAHCPINDRQSNIPTFFSACLYIMSLSTRLYFANSQLVYVLCSILNSKHECFIATYKFETQQRFLDADKAREDNSYYHLTLTGLMSFFQYIM